MPHCLGEQPIAYIHNRINGGSYKDTVNGIGKINRLVVYGGSCLKVIYSQLAEEGVVVTGYNRLTTKNITVHTSIRPATYVVPPILAPGQMALYL